MSEHLDACLNCSTPLEGVWCPRCGQPNRRERLDTTVSLTEAGMLLQERAAVQFLVAGLSLPWFTAAPSSTFAGWAILVWIFLCGHYAAKLLIY